MLAIAKAGGRWERRAYALATERAKAVLSTLQILLLLQVVRASLLRSTAIAMNPPMYTRSSNTMGRRSDGRLAQHITIAERIAHIALTPEMIVTA